MTISKSNIKANSPIALFDSGVGGLTVLNKLKKILPYETFLYYGDTVHMPYGEKTKEQLLEYSSKIFDFFKKNNCKAVVMACNTTSSVIYEDVYKNYDFILFSIVHSVSKVLASLNVNSLGVFATKATITSGAYQNLITKFNPNIKVFGQYCPDWVHFVEEKSMNKPENKQIILSDLRKMLANNPDKIVLGCTHYPFLTDILSEVCPRDMFIDPADYFAEYIKNTLSEQDLLTETKSGSDKFYVSSNPEQFVKASEMFCKLDKEPELLTF